MAAREDRERKVHRVKKQFHPDGSYDIWMENPIPIQSSSNSSVQKLGTDGGKHPYDDQMRILKVKYPFTQMSLEQKKKPLRKKDG